MIWPSLLFGALLGGLSLLPLLVTVGYAKLTPGLKWVNLRGVALDFFLLLTPTLFAWTIDPSLGILATLGAYWWLRHGWTRLAGGVIWPFVAMGAALGLALPGWAYQQALYVALGVGILQIPIAVSQWFGGGPFQLPYQNPLGTIGHRTGLGNFMALVAPFAFLMPHPLGLTVALGCGVVAILSRSAVACGAWMVGMLIVAPWLWPLLLGMALIGLAYRCLERSHQILAYGDMMEPHLKLTTHWSNFSQSLQMRTAVWQATWRHCWRWPTWLIGAGPGAFQLDGRRWTFVEGFREVYNEAHNDYLEFLYEHGVIGMLALAWWVWRVSDGFHWQDPLTASAGAFGVEMLANFPAKVMALAGIAFLVAIGLWRRSLGL